MPTKSKPERKQPAVAGKQYMTITIDRDGAVSLMGERKLIDAFVRRCERRGLHLVFSHLSPCG